MTNLNKNKKVIIDFGANKGQNINYYLLKADVVVCVEANPKLVKEIQKNFSDYIRDKKLFIENVVVVGEKEGKKESIDFYIHKNMDVLSTLINPNNNQDFFKTKIKSKPILEILEKYLTNNSIFYFAKFDLEGYDAIAINAMLKADFYPINISTEVHTLESLEAICNSKKYIGFKVQEGNMVSRYLNLPIKTKKGIKLMKFISHSAGPMGEDIPSDWLTEKSIRNKLRVEGFGWKDVHATMSPSSNPVEIKHSYLFKVGMKRVPILIYRFLLPFALRDNPTFKKAHSLKTYSLKNKR
jgi:FkbM family methyltransferase